jgi:lysophospholipase L1-like esterase
MLIGVLLVLVATGCSSSPSAATASATASAAESVAKAAAERPTWDLVLIGDSVLIGIGDLVARAVEDAHDVDVQQQNWINRDVQSSANGGERSAELLARLRTDEQLRTDVSEAEIILFDVPMGGMKDTCTSDPTTATVETVTACMAEASVAYRADVGPIFDELVALRDPSEAMIRVTDVWQFLYPTFQAAGTYDVARSTWQEMNGAVIDAADQHGIPVIHAYDTFTGPEGDRDPVAAGDVMSDEFHLSYQGKARLAELIVGLGFAPLG